MAQIEKKPTGMSDMKKNFLIGGLSGMTATSCVSDLLCLKKVTDLTN
jgi:hypothetical protein